MPCGWTRTGATVIVLLAAGAPPAARSDDDVAVAPGPQRPAPHAAGRPAGVDLAAHVDINVALPPNQWRVNGGPQGVAFGGRLVIDGNLTIGCEPLPETVERSRRADEAVMARLRAAQRDLLDKVVADPLVPAARRRALELATEADIRRMMAEVAALRDRYAGRRASLGDENWQAFQKDVQVCRRALADPFGDDSLFAAVRAGLEAAAGP